LALAPQLRRRAAILCAALLALAGVVVAAAPARAAAPSGFVGMVAPDAAAGNQRYQASALATMQGAGVTLVRQVFDWAIIERKNNKFAFGAYDPFVAAAARRGIQLMPILFDEPSFLSARPRRSHKRGTYPPKNLNSIAALARAAERWYGPSGGFWKAHPTIPPAPIRVWQIWNEPNLPVYWMPRPNAGQYVRLLKAADSAIHGLDPGAEVVSAGVPQSRLGVNMFAYLRSMLHAGAASAMNTLGVNGYSKTASGMVTLLRRVRSVLNHAGAQGTAIRVTEIGWSDKGPGSPFRLGSAGQARQIRAVVRDFYAVRGALDLRGFTYYDWRDARPYPGGVNFWGLHTGLLKLNGRAKPALRAFSSAANGL
jgi:hypothetical protein